MTGVGPAGDNALEEAEVGDVRVRDGLGAHRCVDLLVGLGLDVLVERDAGHGPLHEYGYNVHPAKDHFLHHGHFQRFCTSK
jgi:hypothetical protein